MTAQVSSLDLPLDSPFDVLVLAGRRDPNDELAKAAGAAHRVLLDIAGEPMLLRVLRTLREHPRVASLLLCSDSPQLVEQIPELANMIASHDLRLVEARETPSQSVLGGLEALAETAESGAAKRPLLLTTADHALLDRAMLDFVFTNAAESGADVLVGLVSEQVITARFPDAERTYLPFRGARYSGANLFALMTEDAKPVIEFWRRAEHDRKQPWKLVRHFGLASLVPFLLKRLDLAAAFERVSQTIGVRVEALEIPIAEAAVDVDKLEDWKLVNEILAGKVD